MKTYLVGGAVRDELLGLPVSDMDYVVVGATVEELTSKFGPPVGVDFPVFLDKATGAQYAMARRERKTGIGYSGFACEFGPEVTLKEDLYRRDLTINALAKDVDTGEIIDYYSGLEDLKSGVLRHVSEAFAEDPLRVIRLARFFARYNDFKVDPDTWMLVNQLSKNTAEMNAIPYERYWLETEKALHGDHFANFLAFIGTLRCVPDFFYDVFGDLSKSKVSWISRVHRVIRSSVDDQTKWLTLMVGLCGRVGLDEQLRGLSSTAAKLHGQVELLNDLLKVHGGCDVVAYYTKAVYEIFAATRAWTLGSPDFYLFQLAMHVDAVVGDKPRELFVGELTSIARAVRKVKSEDFPEVTGKALGEKIKAAREAVIYAELNKLIYKSEIL